MESDLGAGDSYGNRGDEHHRGAGGEPQGREGEDLVARRLLAAGRALAADLDLPAVLDRLLETARELTGARYAALGVLDEQRLRLSQFITSGIDDETRRTIGQLPSGRGVLGALISDPKPLRLRDVGDHPLSYGVPSGHPEMRSFLGVPVMIRGEVWGNLYLTEKQGAPEFSDTDEEAVVVLAEWAGAAIESATLYQRSEQRRIELERAVRGLEATRDIAMAIGGPTPLERVLELVAKRGRALVQARAILILLCEGEDLVVAASAGHAAEVSGLRVPVAGSSSGQVLRRARPQRIADVDSQMVIPPAVLGVSDAQTALLMPMQHGGQSVGVLAAFDRGNDGEQFTDTDEHLLHTFAVSAANAVASAHTVQADRLRSMIAAADSERRRWARELHDETLQILGGLRVLLAGALRRGEQIRYEQAMREAVSAVEEGIDGLRAIITDLRPAALDELGLVPAIEALVEHRRGDGLEVVAELRLDGACDLELDLQTTIYRLLQESLTNVVKHAKASHVKAVVSVTEGRVRVEVRDDGVGFDEETKTDGFGLMGMRERVALFGGTLEVQSSGGGTTVRASIPSTSAPRLAPQS